MGMKKRRNVAGKTTAVATKGKEKREAAEAAEAAEEVGKVAEKSRVLGAAVVEAEERPRWLWSAADEQMSWGSFWCPSWDIEYLGEAYNALYSDVVWEDDVWDLKGIKEVPNP